MKRGLILVLALMLLFTMAFSGCSKDNNNVNENENNNQNNNKNAENNDKDAENKDNDKESSYLDNFNPLGEYPLVKEKETLTMFAPQYALVEDMDTNLLTVEYEEKTNVHINWELAPEQGFTEKRNIVLASGDLPDVFIASNFTPSDRMLYGNQELIIPLNDLIENQTVHYKALLEEYPETKSIATAPDGNIYCVTIPNNCYHCSLSQKMWIYRPWLDALNMDMPTTTEEYFEVLKAVKDNDLNGNGDTKDEIPLAGAITGWHTKVYGYLMNPFIYEDEQHLYFKDGKLLPNYDTDEFKEGLKYMNRLYDEGLLDATSLTNTNTQLNQLARNDGEVILFSFPYGGSGAATGWNDRAFEYEVMPPLEGPDGTRQTPSFVSVRDGGYVITSDCEMPELAMRWVDWFTTTEGGLRSRIGREGQEWAKGDGVELAINGEIAQWKKLTPINEIQNYFWGQGNWPQFFSHSDQSDVVGSEQFLYSESEKMQPYAEDAILQLWIGEEDIADYTQYQTDLFDYVETSIAEFIVGSKDIEADWDSYIKGLDNLGSKEYTQIVNKWYEAKYGK